MYLKDFDSDRARCNLETVKFHPFISSAADCHNIADMDSFD